jgi:hypothetical protein
MKKMFLIAVIFIVCGLAENAMALFRVTPSSLSFGTVPTGQSKTMTVTLNNSNAAQYPNIPVTITYINVAGDTDAFSLAGQNCPTVLNVGSSCTASVIFNPHAGDTNKSGFLQIGTAQEGNFSVWLFGAGAGGGLSFSSTSISFGNVAVDSILTRSVTVTNSYDVAVNLTVSSSYVFQTTNHCSPAPAKGSCTIDVVFAPTETGYESRTISVTWTGGSQSIYVSGTGTEEDHHADDGGGGAGGCFIATAALGPYFDAPVKTLHHPTESLRALSTKIGMLPALMVFIMTAALSFIVVRRVGK